MSVNSYTQNPDFLKIGAVEFANTDVYTVLYDENSGLIYAGTNSGLYVYKEGKFLKLKGPKNQIGNSVFELKRDNFGDIYCKNLNGQILKINKNKDSYELFYELEKRYRKSGQFDFFFSPKNDLIVGSSSVFKTIDLNTRKEEILIDRNSVFENDTKFSNELFLSSYHQDGNAILLKTISDQRKTIFKYDYSKLFIYKQYEFNMETDFEPPESYFSDKKNKPFSINNEGKLHFFESQIIQNYQVNDKERFSYLSDSSFIGMSSQRGFRYFTLKNDTIVASPTIFPNLFISSFYQAKNGTQLLGTFGEGVLVIPQPEIVKTEHDYLFLGIASSPNNEVVVSTRSGEVFNVDNENELSLIGKSSSHVDNVWYVDRKDEETAHNFFFDGLNTTATHKDVKLVANKYIIYANQTNLEIEITEEEIISNKLYVIKGIKSYKYIADMEKYTNVEWLEVDSSFYFSSNLGLYRRSWSSDKNKPILLKGKILLVNDLHSNKNEVICATGNSGVLVYDKNKLKYQLTIKDGLASNMIKQVEFNNNRLFILTNRGMQVYDCIKKEMITLGIKEGFINNRVTKFALSNDKLWLLEKHSFFSIPFEDIQNEPKKRIRLFFTGINVNRNPINYNVENKFDYTANEFEFKFDYRDLLTKEEATILYSISANQESWQSLPARANKIVFDYLAPGSYSFKIKVKYRNTETAPFTYQFEISPPFWLTWWFWGVLFILFFFSVVLYYTSRIKTIKKIEKERLAKQKLLTDAIDSKLKALRSQMNPHFIFNSLNSIQSLILKQETEKSYDYVVLFSDLVRKTLQYSDKDFIAIDDELAFLENYLTLESLRMKEEFTYSIAYAGNKGITIPSLMVQPFIENAIHHGLLHKSGAKNLNILFEFGDEMICTIIDNGVGRVKAKEIMNRQSKNHTSFSLKATKQRMEILKNQHSTLTGFEIIDLYDNKRVLGTKVIMKLPFRYNY